MMNIRNMIRLDDRLIDCEMELRPDFWIPFTAAADDVEEHGRAIFAAADAALKEIKGGEVLPELETIEAVQDVEGI
jgi:hypothetical protein